jgi:two-component system response regulator AtoC
VEHFRRKFNAKYVRNIEIPPDSVRLFMEYHWPGNVRELENAVKRIVVLGGARPVHQEILGNLSRGPRPAGSPASVAPAPVNGDGAISLKDIARQAAREAERTAIKEVLDRVHWNRAKAARLLQISYKALLYKIVQCGLVTPEERAEKTREPREAVAS